MENRRNISNKEEFKEVCNFLKDVLDLTKKFGKTINAKVYYSIGHNWPTISIRQKHIFNNEKQYNINKDIYLSIEDYKYPPIYKVWVTSSNNYGIKEVFVFFPILSKIRDAWKRLRWEKTIGYLDAPINKTRLITLLKEAKQILDNFDESQLQQIS